MTQFSPSQKLIIKLVPAFAHGGLVSHLFDDQSETNLSPIWKCYGLIWELFFFLNWPRTNCEGPKVFILVNIINFFILFCFVFMVMNYDDFSCIFAICFDVVVEGRGRARRGG